MEVKNMVFDGNGNAISVGESTAGIAAIGAKIISGDIKKISLIGDSITDGAAGTGYNGSSSANLSTNTAGYCWANMLKAFLGAKYGTIVRNYGMYGSGINQQVSKFGTTLADADLVIWLTGTNNRNDADLTSYENQLRNAIDTIRDRVPNMIVMSCPPTAKSEDSAHTHRTWEVAGIVEKVAADKGCPFFNMHNAMNEYWYTHETPIAELTPKDSNNKWFDGYGIHPRDAGYHVMLMALLFALGIPVPFYEDLTVSGDYYPYS